VNTERNRDSHTSPISQYATKIEDMIFIAMGGVWPPGAPGEEKLMEGQKKTVRI
jgi:hypothetical protein